MHCFAPSCSLSGCTCTHSPGLASPTWLCAAWEGLASGSWRPSRCLPALSRAGACCLSAGATCLGGTPGGHVEAVTPLTCLPAGGSAWLCLEDCSVPAFSFSACAFYSLPGLAGGLAHCRLPPMLLRLPSQLCRQGTCHLLRAGSFLCCLPFLPSCLGSPRLCYTCSMC